MEWKNGHSDEVFFIRKAVSANDVDFVQGKLRIRPGGIAFEGEQDGSVDFLIKWTEIGHLETERKMRPSLLLWSKDDVYPGISPKYRLEMLHTWNIKTIEFIWSFLRKNDALPSQELYDAVLAENMDMESSGCMTSFALLFVGALGLPLFAWTLMS